MKVDTTIQAGKVLEFYEPGDFFRLMEALDPLTVRFYLQGKEVSQAQNVGEGYAEKFRVGSFDRVQIESATTQAIEFVIRLGQEVAYDKAPTGTVVLTGEQGAFTQAQKAVTNASGQLLAAKATRRYLLVQNNDATGVIYLTVDGGAATTGKGIKIEPGGSYECAGFAPSGAIFAIGSVANNPNVVTVEG